MAKPKHLGVKKYMIVYDVPPQNGKGRQQKLRDPPRRDQTRSGVISCQTHRKRRAGRVHRTRGHDHVRPLRQVHDAQGKAPRSDDDRSIQGIIATYLRPTFGKMRLTALRKAHLIEAYEKWQAEKQTRRSGRTIRHVHDLLRATLNWPLA